MKSFGIWYLPEKNQETVTDDFNIDLWNIEKKNQETVTADLHINLWNIEKKNKQKIEPFIDFGISIGNFRNVKSIKFFFPFAFEDSEFEDLFDKVKDVETARLIFNDNFEISSVGKFYLIKGESDKENMLLVRLKKENGEWENGIQLDPLSSEGRIMSFNFSDIERDAVLQEYQNLYLRFRIKAAKLKEMLFCSIKKKNKYLESGFQATQIVDIKVNKERNIAYDIWNDLRLNDYLFMKFGKIHLLIMNLASDEVEYMGEDFEECRKLETGEWDTYLNNEYNTEDVLAYHWKVKSEGRDIKEFSELVKITAAKTNWKIILAYVGIVIILGAAGSGLCNWLGYLLPLAWGKIIGIFSSLVEYFH